MLTFLERWAMMFFAPEIVTSPSRSSGTSTEGSKKIQGAKSWPSER
jgi:hypothetical protein